LTFRGDRRAVIGERAAIGKNKYVIFVDAAIAIPWYLLHIYAIFYLTFSPCAVYPERTARCIPSDHLMVRRNSMVQLNRRDGTLVGTGGSLAVRDEDEIARKLMMLIEGECEGLGPVEASRKYDYTKQRYFQLRQIFLKSGAAALASQKRGPKTRYRRTSEIVRQIIRYRFLDPQASPAVIGQKLRQLGLEISTRSVERVIADYGLPKKTLSASPPPRHRRR
jgi:hypothetical protein